MHDILPFLDAGRESGKRMAIAIVVQTWGSSPRPAGAMMAVSEDGRVAGSVSGGCVEGAVIKAAMAVIKYGTPQRLEFDELKDEDVWAVGLSCGGRIDIAVFRADHEVLLAASKRAHSRVPFHLTVEMSETPTLALDEGDGIHLGYPAPERLVIIGGVHIAIPLLAFARELEFETILIEPRSTFAQPDRFPVPADRVIESWPAPALEELVLDASTYAVLLTHDPKIDDQALHILLRSEVAYVGSLGSRSTQSQRRDRLAKEGFTEEEIARIHGPVGLSIGAKSPAEIALSIMAEIVQVRRSRS